VTFDPLAGLDPCVHCGFCLQACPTFLVTGDEADSPRGRIVLMQAVRRGAVDPADEHLGVHLDRCLGCRACETACPSGVSYGPALEAVRERLLTARPVPALASAVLAVVADQRLWKPMFGLTKVIRPLARLFTGWSRLGFAMGMVSSTRALTSTRGIGSRSSQQRPSTADTDDTRPTAVVFRGCIMDGLFGHVHRATERVLDVNGNRVVEVTGQVCCGALHAHAGRIEEARDLARRNLVAFATHGDARIVVNSAGCGAMLKAYGHLMVETDQQADAEVFARRVFDVSEVLAESGPKVGNPLPLRVAYDPPCHLHHAQRVTDAPLRMLDAIPDLTRVELSNAADCCGSAGLYSLLQREMSIEVLQRKVTAIRAVSPDYVVSGNPGCLMHIGAGLAADGQRTLVAHPVELLDWSYHGLGRMSRRDSI